MAIASEHNGLELITDLTIALNSGVRCSTDDDGMVDVDDADETVTVDDEEDAAVTNIQFGTDNDDDDESVDICGTAVFVDTMDADDMIVKLDDAVDGAVYTADDEGANSGGKDPDDDDVANSGGKDPDDDGVANSGGIIQMMTMT